MFDFYKVAAAVPDLRVADVSYNLDKMLEMIDNAKANNASMVVFPELGLTGYTCGDLFFQTSLIEDTRIAINRLVSYSLGTGLLIIFGAPINIDGQLYNAALSVYEGRLLGINIKTFLPNYNEFYEKRWFSSAAELRRQELPADYLLDNPAEVYMVPVGNDFIINMKGQFTYGVEICEDLWAPVTPSTYMALSGAELMVNLSASNDTIGKRSYRQELIRSKSKALMCDYLYVSAGSGESTTDLVFSGHTMLYENGRRLMENEHIADNDYIMYSDIDLGKVRADRIKGKTFKDAASLYGSEIRIVNCDCENLSSDCNNYELDKHPFIPSDKNKRLARCKDIFAMQVGGLAKRASITGGKLVIGVSGGMDSTLALLVGAQTLKKLNRPLTDLVGITMPAFGTTDRTYNNSIKLMETLGITIKTIPIKEACLVHYADIEHDISEKDITFENVQARERTQVLMDYANKIGGIVVGTGDLSELALGWCTYNADQMSMYGVNASIPKTLVRWMIDAVIEHNIFPDSTEVLRDILDTPISPELLPPDENGNIVQKTEDSVGPYELHDFFLFYVMRYGFSPDKIYYLAKLAFAGDYTDETILKWMKMFYRRFFSQQFKRSCMPDGVKVGSVCLSPRGDWRMPSDASVTGWLKKLEEL